MAINLDSIAIRAQRQLDGMTVNRETFARDVLQLVNQLKSARAAAGSTREDVPGQDASTGAGFSGAFDDIFGRIFGASREGSHG